MATSLTLVPPTESQIMREALCDEFGKLKGLDDANKLAHAPTAARLKLVTATIQSWIPSDLPGDQDTSFEGRNFKVFASIRKNESKITSMGKLKVFLGTAKFFSICKVGVEALEEVCGKAGAAIWFTKAPTGYRTLSAVAISRPDKAA